MVPLLIFLPALTLFLAALGMMILQQARPSIGYAWLIGTLASLLTVGLAIMLRWQIPAEMVAGQWRMFADLSTPPAFRLDSSSWPYLFSLAVLALGFILTDAARLETEARPFNWAVGLAITGLGMLAVLASNAITLVVIWTALDLAEFMMIMSTPAGRRLAEQTIIVFSVRVAGTLLVLVAVLVARSQGLSFTLSSIPTGLAMLMLVAAGLRLGVLPLNLSYMREVYTWRGLGNVMRMVSPATSLVVLSRLPGQMAVQEWTPLLFWLSALAAAYGGVLWLTAENELSGRSYWSTALAAMAVASALNGSPRASVAWGSVLILSGSALFFYSARRKSILILPLLGLLGLVGLPFTPASVGWAGLIGQSFGLATALFLFTALCLVWGYLRHVLRPRDELYRLERWVHTVYPAGLLFLASGPWLIGLLGGPGTLVLGPWWASLVVLVIGSLGLVLAFFLRRMFLEDALRSRWIDVYARRTGAVLGAFFRLNWLYRFIAGVYTLVQNGVQLLTAMLEGDGGILWSMVILALLISLIVAGGQP